MAEEAPRSSDRVRYVLLRHLTDGLAQEVDRMEISTRVDVYDRAVTTIRLQEWNEALYYDMIRVLRTLPGLDGSPSWAGVSREFDVTWRGACRPY